MEEIIVKKKLSHNIERVDLKMFTCYYQYKFSTNQWLESVDNFECMGIKHNDSKQGLIDNLVSEFRISLNAVIFGDPAGREYVEWLEENKK